MTDQQAMQCMYDDESVKLASVLDDIRYQTLLFSCNGLDAFNDGLVFKLFGEMLCGEHILFLNHVLSRDNSRTCLEVLADDSWIDLQSMMLISYMLTNPGSRAIAVCALDDPIFKATQVLSLHHHARLLIKRELWLEQYIKLTNDGLYITQPGQSGQWGIIVKRFSHGKESTLTGEWRDRMLIVINAAQDCTDDAFYMLAGQCTGEDNRIVMIGTKPAEGSKFAQALSSDKWETVARTA